MDPSTAQALPQPSPGSQKRSEGDMSLADRPSSTSAAKADELERGAPQSSPPPAATTATIAVQSPPKEKAKGSVAALMARFQFSPVPTSARTPASQLALVSPAGDQAVKTSLSSPAASEQDVAAAIHDLPYLTASEGAISLTSPDSTIIENPFRTSRPQTPEAEAEPFRPLLAAASTIPKQQANVPADTTDRDSSSYLSNTERAPATATAQEAEAGPSTVVTDVVSPSSFNRFSFVSLTSTVDQNESDASPSAQYPRSSTVLNSSTSERTLAPQLQVAAESTSPPVGLQERLMNRMGEQSSRRESATGIEILRENFQKIHRESKRHTRTTSDVAKTGANLGAEDGEPEDSSGAVYTQEEGREIADEETDGVDWNFWGKVMSNYQEVAHHSPQELSRAIQAGIPSQLRGLCWQLLSASKDIELEIVYAWYIRQKTSPHEKQIKKDLNRTFPEQEYFRDGRVGQENLYNVVKAYSLYDEEVGYVQGMGFIVGPLLLNMPDEEAFSTLVRLMKSYGLRSHFLPNMPGLQLRLFQFDRLLEDMLPLLHRHLTREGVKTSHYATQWFMTLFSYRYPSLDFVYRVLDSIFAEGIEAIFRFAMALMTAAEDKLLTLNFEQALEYLKNTTVFERYKLTHNGCDVEEVYDVDRFACDAYAVQIQTNTLDQYASEFEESLKAATAHRRELQAARIVNRNLAAKVAELEDQLEKIQAEHVELVKDAVLSKVAKEETEIELIRYKMLYAELVLQTDQAGSAQSIRLSRQSSAQSNAARPSTAAGSNSDASAF